MNKKLQFRENLLKLFSFVVILVGIYASSYANAVIDNPSLVIQLKESKVTLKLDNVSIKSILYEIQKQTKINFIYTDSELNSMDKKSIHVKNATVVEVLNTIFAETNFNYRVNGNSVAILKKTQVTKPNEPKMTMHGKVVDVAKSPIPGATVIVKGTPQGAITDDKGLFTITARRNVILEVSFMGMKSVVVDVATATMPMVITMEEETLAVDDVVVTGYQKMDRRDALGSYKVVKMNDILNPNYSTVDQMLQGQVAGMVVQRTSSRAGTSPKINIRGVATFGNQDPIWVVDGVIQDEPISIKATTNMANDLKNILGNQVSWLNPNDIETITVLKDASMTAVYGSKASNGVIVVTTKKGVMGKERFSVNYGLNLTLKTRPDYDDFGLMNSQERIRFSEEAYAFGVTYAGVPMRDMNVYEGVLRKFLNREISSGQYVKRKNELEIINTDWFDLLTRNAFGQQHNLSFAGGGQKSYYRASFSYNDENGQEIGNDSHRLTGRLAVGFQPHKNLKIDVTLAGSTGKTKGFSAGINPLDYAITTSRAIPAYEENGDYAYLQKTHGYKFSNIESLSYNILNEMEHSGSLSDQLNLNANLNLGWKIRNWIEYQLTAGYNNGRNSSESWAGERTYYIASQYRGYDFGTAEAGSPAFLASALPYGGTLFTNDNKQSSYNIQNKLVLSKTFASRHRLNVLLGTEVRSSYSSSLSNSAYGYLPDRGQSLAKPRPANELVAMNGNPPFDLAKEWGILGKLYSGEWFKATQTNNFFSLFATMAYSFDNRYVVNMNVRNDASNRFGQDENKRFNPTYSMGLSWSVTNEPFMKDRVKWLSNLRLQATYGVQGNALTNMSPDLIVKQPTSTSGTIADIYNAYQVVISQIPNPHLSWESTKSWNFGGEVQLFNTLTINVDYYRRNSNAIISMELPYELGFDKASTNGGKITNEGIEGTVAYTLGRNKKFGMNISLNSSKNWNKTGEAKTLPTYKNFLTGVSDRVIKEGYPIGAFWSYSFAGLDGETGLPTFNKLDITEEQGRLDPSVAMVYSGQSDPYFTGGLNLNIRYGQFNLATNFAVLLGGKRRLITPYSNFASAGNNLPLGDKNLMKELDKRWKKTGDEVYTNIPSLPVGSEPRMTIPGFGAGQGIRDMWMKSDLHVVNASFLRCTGVNLSYNFPQKMLAPISMKSLSLTASVSNLFVIASKRYNGFDPELGNSTLPKSFTFGLSVGF